MIVNISKIRAQSLVILTINDTLLPSTVKKNYSNESLDIFKINCKRLSAFCEETGSKIILMVNGDEFFLYHNTICINTIYQKTLGIHTIGASKENINSEIKKARQNRKIDIVLVINSVDLSTECNNRDNSYFFKSNGFIDADTIFKLTKAIKDFE
jgi:hypothetical protein